MDLSPTATPYNITYQWVEFPSDEFIQAAELLAYATAVLSLGLYALSLWVIVGHSPRMMGSYRWYLLFNSSVATAVEVLYAVIFPLPLLPYPVVTYGGLLRLCAPLNPVLLFAIQEVWALVVATMGTAVITLFSYRYSQLTRNWLYKWLLQNTPLVIALNLLLTGTCVFVLTAPPNFDFSTVGTNSERLLEGIRRVDSRVYERIRGQNVLEYLVMAPC